MRTNQKTIAVSEFKTHCLAVLARVVSTGEAIVVTKRGRPIAHVTAVQSTPRSPLRGSVRTLGDIVDFVDPSWSTGEAAP